MQTAFFSHQREWMKKDQPPNFSMNRASPKYTAETCLDGLHRIVLELRAKRFDTWAWYELAEMADEFAIEQRQADELIALAHLKERWEQVGVIPYPHQLNTAKKKLSLKCRAKPFWRMR